MSQTALLVTIDVEEDMPRWTVEPETTVQNASALPRLQRLCEELGVRPTYLVDYPMATQNPARDIIGALAQNHGCEIGAHLHPWNTPPLPDGLELEPRRATQLPVPLMEARLETLTHTLEQQFGRRPTSFRAGRFGLNGATLCALEKLGYQVDSSLTPGFNWTGEGGEDYTHVPTVPYFADRRDPRRPGDSTLYEIPVTTGFTQPIPATLARLYHRTPRWTHLRGALSSDHAGLLDFLWLCPGQYPIDGLIRLVDVLMGQGATFLNVFFHSSELYPGSSIYTKTPEEADAYFDRLRQLFQHILWKRDGWGCTLSEFRHSQAGPPMSALARGSPKVHPKHIPKL